MRLAINNDEFKKKDISVAVLCWNVSTNALGRAYMLADILSSRYKIKLIGFAFKKHAPPIWEPLKDAAIPIISFPGSHFPDLMEKIDSIAPTIDADVILACKPKMPSLQLGLMIKAQYNRPLILDIDDYELGFNSEELSYEINELKKPDRRAWTGLAESLICYADHILVSNAALQQKYGGTVIPHSRREEIFNPELYSKEERRKELGISQEDKIVLFLGTPRLHKGLVELLEAIKLCGKPNYKLCVMGSFPNNRVKERLLAKGGQQLLFFPNQPFEDIPKNIAVADAVCILQDPTIEASKYQLPAKAIDAVAMGVPVLAYKTPPLEPMIKQGLVIPVTRASLPEDIDKVLSDSASMHKKLYARREVFLQEYSYGAVLERLDSVIIDSLREPKILPENALSFLRITKEILTEVESNRLKLKDREKEFKTLKAKHDKVIQSHSWKFTKPLRIFTNIIRRALRR